jgi:hypothetical protein
MVALTGYADAFELIQQGHFEALSARCNAVDVRVGQQIQRNARAEIEGLIIQMMAIEKLAHAALPEVGRELLDLALAEEETATNRAEGRKAH